MHATLGDDQAVRHDRNLPITDEVDVLVTSRGRAGRPVVVAAACTDAASLEPGHRVVTDERVATRTGRHFND